MASQPWVYAPPEFSTSPGGAVSECPDIAPPGLTASFVVATFPRLARRGLKDDARFTGSCGWPTVILAPIGVGGKGVESGPVSLSEKRWR
jgi:hypothetical protein